MLVAAGVDRFCCNPRDGSAGVHGATLRVAPEGYSRSDAQDFCDKLANVWSRSILRFSLASGLLPVKVDTTSKNLVLRRGGRRRL